MDFVTKSFRKILQNTIAITPKNEDKYVVKVFNWSEFHLSEMTLLQNPYFSRVLEDPGLKEIFFKIVLGLNIIYKLRSFK